jgi:Ca2+-transporting ATPase
MNQMVVQEIYTPNEISEREFLSFATLACEPEPFDPMEQAILEYATQHSIDDKTLFAMQLVAEYPFSSESKMMGHIWRIGEDNCLSAKGSPESILPLCNLSPEIQQQLIQKQEFFAHQGYRVIAVAINKSVPTILPQLKDNPLKFIGLIALMDPPRVAVAPAIAICTKAGIRVVMITGDNGITAQSIAKKIRIPHSENIISGIDVDKMSAEELQSRVVLTNIFARVTPNQKLRIVKAFKESGQVVAMTGDGVNDAPALKYADIGIAMGKRGTVVAKEAADMILLDDNFTTIVETIHDGRRIYENIKKAIAYVFVIHIPIALIALLTPLFKIPLLLLPIHVVLLELIIDPTCSIIFERQAVDEDIMERKPRSSDESLINAALLTKAIFQGITIFAVTFGIYVFIYFQKKAQLANQGLNVELLLNTLKGHELQHFTTQLTSDARGVALLTFVFANLILVYVNQSSREYVLKSVFHSKDKVIWYINLTILLVMGLCIYTPYGNTLLQTQALNFFQILLALGLAAAATLWWEIVKLFQNTNRQKI